MKQEKVKILYYSNSPLSLPIPNRELIMKGGSLEEPAVELVTMDEVRQLFVNTHLIRSGRVEFEKEQREAIYEELGFTDWQEECLFENDLDTILSNPTKETMQRVVDMKDASKVERLWGRIVMHQNARDLDISMRFRDVVEARRKELAESSAKSRIEIFGKDTPAQPTFSAEFIAEMVAKQVALELAKVKTAEVSAKDVEPVKEPEVTKPIPAPAPAKVAAAKPKGRPAAKK